LSVAAGAATFAGMKALAAAPLVLALLAAPAAHAGTTDPSDPCAAVFAQARAGAAEAAFSGYVGFARVRLDGDGPHWMLVDTGANRSALDAGLAGRLGLPELGQQQVEGSAGVIRTGSTRLQRLELGAATIEGLSPTVSDLSGLVGPDGEPVAGILGSDAFIGRLLLLDFAGGRIGLTPADPAAGSCDRAIPFTLDNGMVRYTASLDGQPVDLRHDSGAGLFETTETYVNLTEAQHAAVAGPAPGEPAAHFSGSGAGGTVSLAVYRAGRFELGPVTRDAPWLIVQPRQGYFAREDAIGFVGNYVFWAEGVLLFDYPAGRVILPPAG